MMAEVIQMLFTFLFFVFLWDQKQISRLQRAGQYDTATHRTMMSRVLPVSSVVRRLLDIPDDTTKYQPPGDLTSYNYETTVCLDKLGRKTRLSYFFDQNKHAWFKIEKIDRNGVSLGGARYEPAITTFNEKKLQFV